MKILVIAPHPDDEVLGCGGAIRKHINQGDEVYLCIVTKAYTPDWTQEFIDNRKKEIGCANKVLGVKETTFLDLPTVKLDTIGQKKLNDLIVQCIDKVKPEILYIPFSKDSNEDHCLISKACLIALKLELDSSIKKVLFYSYESPLFMPNLYIDISDTLEDKLEAMSCYKSEVKDYPHSRSLEAIKISAQKRGIESGLKAAEAFIIIKEIIRTRRFMK